MAFKYVALFALISSAAAVAIQSYHGDNSQIISGQSYQAGNLLQSGHYRQQEEEHYAPAHYQFAYDVHDEHTGDIKSQKESRDGDRVEGFYTLVEPDGHRRIVHYTADKHSGFNAKVEREFLGEQYVQRVNNHQQQQQHGIQIQKIVAQPVQYVNSHSLNQGLNQGHYAQYQH